MTQAWVDFKEIKAAVTMEQVLSRYGVNTLTRHGDELRGACPIHKGARKGKNFSVNIVKNAFTCFSKDCGARGNVLDFVAAMERCDVRSAALKLKDWFKVGESPLSSPHEKTYTEKTEIQRGIYKDKDGALYEVLASAQSGQGFERLVVYRELFGDYQFWVLPTEKFGVTDSYFTLVKPL